uniref:Cell wall integrity and stress response component 4-like n=1 Tax=Diabrotica virgifera virgifera TaxID=50390 RepID=A0A6P7G0S7_DIAVI
MQPIKELFNSEKQILTFEETVDLFENAHGTKDVNSVVNKYTVDILGFKKLITKIHSYTPERSLKLKYASKIHEDTTNRIFLTLDNLCFICKQHGHISSSCSVNVNHSETAVPTATLSNRNEPSTVTSTETTAITPSTTCTSTIISNNSTPLTKILSTTNVTPLDTSTTDNTMPVISKPNISTSSAPSSHIVITNQPSSSSLSNNSCSVNENKENPAPKEFSVSNEENTSKSSSKRTVSEAISPPIETSASDDVFSKPTQKQKRIKTKISTIPLETLMQPIKELFSSEKQILTFEETVDLFENAHGTKDTKEQKINIQ